jgi:hypothetical protein
VLCPNNFVSMFSNVVIPGIKKKDVLGSPMNEYVIP